eukprot:1497412-Pyramimonas_sp.AAC.1
MNEQGAVLRHPMGILDWKSRSWRASWAPEVLDPEATLRGVLGVVRDAVRDNPEPLPPLSS